MKRLKCRDGRKTVFKKYLIKTVIKESQGYFFLQLRVLGERINEN